MENETLDYNGFMEYRNNEILNITKSGFMNYWKKKYDFYELEKS